MAVRALSTRLALWAAAYCCYGHCQQSGGRHSKPAIEQPPIDSRLRALNRHRANGFRIVGRRAYAPDDGITKSLLLHGLEAGKEPAPPDAPFSRLRAPPARCEKMPPLP